jgi:uncharacterized protein (TIGR01244 family)
MTIQEIKNYRQVNDLLSLGGQPTEEQLKAIAREGFKIVINLATINPRYSLEDEGASVRAVGMSYYHVPVEWTNPTEDDFESFENILRQLGGEKTFIHCAANLRATAFYRLYALKHLGWSEEQMNTLMAPVWDSSSYPIWDSFIDEMKATIKRDAI